ncbi:hypothetical protein GCM10009000_045880 [Halobacterium noricense]|uniref:PQQ-like domain-containing protein n=1 Tax=Haladaptatus pallidirubidus TaxID=1008152 RepID=A0AAV3UF06_9EURY
MYVGTDYNKFYAFDAETGETRWLHDHGKNRVWTTPAIVNGNLYVGSSEGEVRIQGGLYELREA